MPAGSSWSPQSAVESAQRSLAALAADARLRDAIVEFVDLAVSALRSGGKILVCGNGGSACEASHFAEELTGRFRKSRAPLAALACTDAGHITCTANDFGFDEVFSRWISALAKPDDLVVLLSTSGNSTNIVRGCEAASRNGAATVALLGGDGGVLAGRCTLDIIAPGPGSDRIQELHLLILHAVVEGVEHAMFHHSDGVESV